MDVHSTFKSIRHFALACIAIACSTRAYSQDVDPNLPDSPSHKVEAAGEKLDSPANREITWRHLHAYSLRHKLRLNPAEVLETRKALQENCVLMLFGIISFIVAFWNAGRAGFLYIGVGLFFWIHGTFMGKKVLAVSRHREGTLRAPQKCHSPTSKKIVAYSGC